MIKISDKHKSIFWHIHKTGGSYVEYILDRYYDFNIKWSELGENKEIEQQIIVIDNDEDFMIKLKELEVYLETRKKDELELQEKHKKIKQAIELIKPDINWDKKYYLIPNEKTNLEILSNCEEFELNINNEKIQILLCDNNMWNKLEANNKGLLGYQFNNKNSVGPPISLEKWKTYFKFCVTRNPYDRAISSYEFLKQLDKDKEHRVHPFLKKEECDFKYLYTHEEELNHNGYMHYHAYASQSLNIKDSLHGIKMDYIAKYENLEEEIVNILQKMGITEFPHLQLVKDNIKINKTKKKYFETYFDEETLQIINERFKEDFETFGYKMYTNVQELNEHLLELNNEELNNQKRIDLLHKYYDENTLPAQSAFIENFLLEQEQNRFEQNKLKQK